MPGERLLLAPAWQQLPAAAAWAAAMYAQAQRAEPAQVLYAGRNLLVRCAPPAGDAGGEVVVKCFQPGAYQRLIYRLRRGKARRSFEHAARLLQLGFSSPAPLAVWESRDGCLAGPSAYACRYLPGLQEIRVIVDQPLASDVAVAAALGRFVARLHAVGIWHRDLTPGNVLFDRHNLAAGFHLVDVNRMRFGRRFTLAARLQNLLGLCLDGQLGETFLQAYAEAAGLDAKPLQPRYQNGREAYRRFRARKNLRRQRRC